MANYFEQKYLSDIERIIMSGKATQGRNGDVYREFGLHYDIDLYEGYPLLTTKKMAFSSMVKETLWFLRGETNTKTLGCKIWDEWADENGELGPIYGKQWRSWGENRIDQVSESLRLLQEDPYSRRNIISAWNVDDLSKMALPPCHVLSQFLVDDGNLTCIVYQRSADMMLGVPFNIASYSLLTHLFAKHAKLRPTRLIWNGGDCHVYQEHADAALKQASRGPRKPPALLINADRENLWDYRPSDFILVDYNHLNPISYVSKA